MVLFSKPIFSENKRQSLKYEGVSICFLFQIPIKSHIESPLHLIRNIVYLYVFEISTILEFTRKLRIGRYRNI